jgi:3-methyladenine DNA glycosylase AlkD
MLENLKKEMKEMANPEKAKLLQRFFKTGKGEYGEGDIFLGITVPSQRILAKKYQALPMNELSLLLHSQIHEHRLTALLILIERFRKAKEKEEIFNFYLSHTKNINNWDLVDLSSHVIVGNYLLDKPRKILYSLANSNFLWERRIAVISTFAFIKNNQLDDAVKLSSILLKDKQDLIHKAVGWVLREVGKKNLSLLESFLSAHCPEMPRTALRYAIEKFPKEKREYYLKLR